MVENMTNEMLAACFKGLEYFKRQLLYQLPALLSNQSLGERSDDKKGANDKIKHEILESNRIIKENSSTK